LNYVTCARERAMGCDTPNSTTQDGEKGRVHTRARWTGVRTRSSAAVRATPTRCAPNVDTTQKQTLPCQSVHERGRDDSQEPSDRGLQAVVEDQHARGTRGRRCLQGGEHVKFVAVVARGDVLDTSVSPGGCFEIDPLKCRPSDRG
jgi:hypothetical protein